MEFQILDTSKNESAADQKIFLLETEIESLKRKNSRLEKFAAIAAHDLKSPLNSITQFAEILNDDFSHLLGSEGSHYLKRIIDAGGRLRSTIDDLLSLHRAGHGLGALEWVDTKDIVTSVLNHLDADLKLNSALIKTENLPVVWGENLGLSQVFQNLISNSLKYRSEHSPRVLVKALDTGDSWEFSIDDNGRGFPKKAIETAFDAFSRFHSHEHSDGTGLGLPIVKRIVELHGGKISIDEKRRDGTTVFFSLPKTEVV